MKTFWAKDGNCLRPSSEEAEQYLAKIAQGEEVQAEIKRPRNLKFHKRFMKMCSLIAENAPGNYTPREIAGLLEIRTGHVKIVKAKGEIHQWPEDINFAAMDEVEFEKLVNDCTQYVFEAIIPGLEPGELRAELEKF